MNRLWTVGTSTRTPEEFLELLQHYGIVHVVDVRRFPTSRQEHLKKEHLQRLLETKDIRYTYLGDLLGGFRKGGYEEYMKTEPFKQGVQRLLEIAATEPTVMICAERLPWRCHRRFIAVAAEVKGFEVVHIIEKDRTWIPRRPLLID